VQSCKETRRAYQHCRHHCVPVGRSKLEVDSALPEVPGAHSRQADASNITLDNVRSYRAHTQWELEHKDVAAPTINMKDWPKTIQSLVEYLKGCLGVTKIPLAYVIRDEPGVFPDPQGGHIKWQIPERMLGGDQDPIGICHQG